MDRYRLALTRGETAYHDAVEEDRDLLSQFGLGLLSVQNGLRLVSSRAANKGKINPWDVMPMSPQVWKWLRPLLLELEERRSGLIDAASGEGCAK